MNEAQVSQYITSAFEGVDVIENMDTLFFFYNPADMPPDHMFPFATLVTSDIHDQFSDLNRPSVFRLNIGVRRQTFASLFGLRKDSAQDHQYDFTALDQLMPHPVYGQQHWVCILNPTTETFDARVRPLLAEAYEMAVRRRRRPTSRT